MTDTDTVVVRDDRGRGWLLVAGCVVLAVGAIFVAVQGLGAGADPSPAGLLIGIGVGVSGIGATWSTLSGRGRAVVALVAVAVGAAIAVAGARGAILLGAPLFGGGAVVLARVLLSGEPVLAADPDGVVVREGWRRRGRTLRWVDVDRFEVRDGGRGTPLLYVYGRRTPGDGPPGASLYQDDVAAVVSPIASVSDARDGADALNDLRQRLGGPGLS